MKKDKSDIVEHIRIAFDDTKEIASWCDDSYWGEETRTHLLGLYRAALDACKEIEQLRRENSILRHELKLRLGNEFIESFEFSEHDAEVAAERYITHMIAHNEGAE
jgi:hypothetical protein